MNPNQAFAMPTATEFPILDRPMKNGRRLVYLDSAATMLKPRYVVEALSQHYLYSASNIHRGVHTLSEEATADYEATRLKVQKFINAPDSRQVVFTSGTTAAINLVAKTFVERNLKIQAGDEILITHMEHHANIVPWQMLVEQTGCVLKVAPINDRGEVIQEEFERLLGPRTKFASFIWVSNTLGTINPIKKMIAACKKRGVPVMIDGAQAVAHFPVDVQDLDCDFFAFSAHKLCGISGVGILFGKAEHLEKMPPLIGGGDMIKSVTFEKTTFADPPSRFEAGTPAIGGAIALGSAIEFLGRLSFERIHEHEAKLLAAATAQLSEVPGVRLIGTAANKVAIVSFVVEGVHAHDMGTLLDDYGVAVRTGHHCTQPLMKRFGVAATTRASFALYNTLEDVSTLIEAVKHAQEVFR